jgi:tonB-dependent receptor domain protein
MKPTAFFLFIIAMCLLPCWALAQKEVVHGVIKDSTGEPLPLAVVLTVNPKDSSIVAHTVSNAAGIFRVKSDLAEGTYWLQAHQIGFVTVSREVHLPTQEKIEFVLKDDPKEIEAVRIGARRGGMKREGDTVGYNLKAYATGMEKTLGDVLANLPGIKVAQDGKVTAQGKKVDKILFNGRDYFGDNVSMATKNIDANVADTVRVIKGYSEYDILNGFQNIDKTVIDVGVKPGMLNKIFGKIEAGGGYKNAYAGNAKATYMDKNHMFTALVASNNVADPVFSIMDYIALKGGLQDPESGGYKINISLAPSLMPAVFPEDDTYKMQAHAANILYNYHKEKKLKVSTAVLAAKAENDTKSETKRTFMLGTQQGSSFMTGKYVSNQMQHGLGTLSVTYNPTEKLMLMAGGVADYGTLDTKTTANDYYAMRLLNNIEKRQEAPLTWSTNGGIYFRPNAHLFFLSYAVEGKQNKPTYDLNTSELLLPLNLLPNNGRYMLRFLTKQDQVTASLRLGTRLKLTETQELKFWLEGANQNKHHISYFESASTLTVRPTFQGDLSTDLRFKEYSAELGGRWSFKNDKWNLRLDLAGKYLNQDAQQAQLTNKKAGFYFTPGFAIDYDFTPAMGTGIQAYSRVNAQQADELLYGMQIKNYRSLTHNRGFSHLGYRKTYADYHFNYFPTEAAYSAFFRVDYMKETSPLSQYHQMGLLTSGSPYAIGDSEQISSSLRLENRFVGIWTVTLDGGVNYSIDDILSESQLAKMRTFAQTLNLSARSSYSAFFNTELSLSGKRTQYELADAPRNIDYEAYCNAKLLFTWEKFRLEIGGGYSVSALDKNSPVLFSLDTELSYEFPHRISAVLTGVNLLNIDHRKWKDISYSALIRSERIYYTIPGYAMLKLRWEFGSEGSSRTQIKVIRK